jgi:catechol 2,3-dioxygenase-like lactoylglutathione lyase family enzyme
MIKKIDHLVITVFDVEKTIGFYEKLGFKGIYIGGRYELHSCDFKINLHILGNEFSPHALNVQPGSADLCFEIEGNIDAVKNELESKGVKIELGIVERTGIFGEMKSIYTRDPNGNLLEFSSYA